MKSLFLSVFSDISAFITENLTTVLMVGGAVLVAIALIVIIACSVRISKEKRRRKLEKLNTSSKSAGQTGELSSAEPAEQPAEVVAEELTEQPAEVVAEELTEQPAEVVAAEPVEQLAEVVAEELTEQPAEVVAEELTEQPAEVVAAEPVEQLAEVVAEEPAEQPAEVVAEEPAEQPAEVVAAEPAEQPAEVVAEELAEQPAEVVAEETANEAQVAEQTEAPQANAEAAAEQQNAAQPAAVKPGETVTVNLTAEERAEIAEQMAKGNVTVIRPRPGMFIRYRYNRSFSAKLIQSDEKVKRYYSELKNELLEYKKVVPRVSWRHESFRYGRPSVAKFVIRGKTLCLCLALNPADYAESKYIVDDMSRYAKFANTPLLYRIKNDRRCRYAKELIAKLFDGAELSEHEEEDFSQIPYEETQALVERGLIKVVSYQEVAISEQPEENIAEEFEDDDDFEGEEFEDDDEDELEEVNVSEVSSLMADDKAKLRVQQGNELSDKSKTGVINIDTLGQFFDEGEKVTLAEIKRRVPFVAKNLTYIKVLARGTLSKPLVVVADDFSLEAVKMIVLTGGRAIRTKKKN